MQQLRLDFSGCTQENGTNKSEEGNKTELLSMTVVNGFSTAMDIPREKYTFSEEVQINNILYEFRISHQIKEGSYDYDEKSGKIRSIVFLLKTGNTSYKFKIGVSNYLVISGKGEDMVDHISHLDLSYIHKIDNNNHGARYINGHGTAIKNFEYFKYIFGSYGIHPLIISIIKRVILDIRSKKQNTL